MKPLTELQQRVLNYCQGYVIENDNQPTVRNIQEHFGWASTNAAAGVLRALVKKGYIEYYIPHSFRFTKRPTVN